MKYIEKGYKEISRGVFVKTYELYEDGTPATDKQKTAIKNLQAWLKTDNKKDHASLGKKELNRINRLTKVQAMKEIGDLISNVNSREDDSWDMPW